MSGTFNLSILSNFVFYFAVIVDLTPPETGVIIDGVDPEFQDVVYSSEAATISAQWTNYTDPESGIRDHKISVYRKHYTKYVQVLLYR